MVLKKLLLITGLFCFLASCGQDKMTSGVVTYKLQTQIDSTLSAQLPQTQTFSFNAKYVKIEDGGGATTIVDAENKQNTIFANMLGQDIALEAPFEDSVEVEFLDEQKTIAGYAAKKAKLISGKGEETVWLSEEIRAPYSVLGKIPGFVLEFSTQTPAGELVYVVESVSKEDLDDAFFEGPEGFKKMTLQEFGVLMMQQQMQQGPQKGDQAAPFSKNDWFGEPVDLLSLRGNVVVLNFWFAACKPCIVELPVLNKLVEKYRGQPVKFLAITFDDKATVQKFLDAYKFAYQVIPAAEDVVQNYGVSIFPTHVVIDKNGVVVEAFSDALEDELALVAAIEGAK